MKVVINANFGGFGLSDAAEVLYNAYAGEAFCPENVVRSSPHLLRVVQELGCDANGEHSMLKVVDVPDDVVEWTVEEYDGHEWVAEKHRSWR